MFITHFFYRGYVVYTQTLLDARTAPKVVGASNYMIWITPEKKEPGTELADWAWEMELAEAGCKRFLVEKR